MNFLAHFHLSDGEEDLAGQWLADHLEPGWRDGLPAGVLRGVRLHQRIDSFTDAHPAALRSRRRLPARFRRYGGILVDVFYDHFLARQWACYRTEPLGSFAARCYETLGRQQTALTRRGRFVLERMAAQDWLSAYAQPEGAERALAGIGRRLRRANPLHEAGGALAGAYDGLGEDFAAFFPELERFAAAERERIALESIVAQGASAAGGTGSGALATSPA